MRGFGCSALVVVLVVAGCGGGGASKVRLSPPRGACWIRVTRAGDTANDNGKSPLMDGPAWQGAPPCHQPLAADWFFGTPVPQRMTALGRIPAGHILRDASGQTCQLYPSYLEGASVRPVGPEVAAHPSCSGGDLPRPVGLEIVKKKKKKWWQWWQWWCWWWWTLW